MTIAYRDDLITVEINVDISDMAIGNSQADLSDGIKFTIRSENAHMIQFKSKLMKWLEGPKKGTMDSDIPGFSKSVNELEWGVDVFDEDKPNPYYDESGACVRSGGCTIIADQPDVSHVVNADYNEETGTFTKYPVKNMFCGASIIIVDNSVRRVVAWTRTGTSEGYYYRVRVAELGRLSLAWRDVLIKNGFNVPPVA
ncbi:hypothetical protein IF690_19720 [Pseudomonas sp. SK3(2021)]|uniref:hypothetical protein n=1 Tax=Pseudomonas sp. SK3(2021) TaxID=2841064 RepID=UPI00192A849A|nr:hypothetical protein [Pseudomonas sp. SK3(2021)]QQZ40246.1 hypothetical protein IF690_19720 [Pseudomonas sp. SK3(2021)]